MTFADGNSTDATYEGGGGGAIFDRGGIGVSWSIYNSTFTGNRAIGRGANLARPETPWTAQTAPYTRTATSQRRRGAIGL